MHAQVGVYLNEFEGHVVQLEESVQLKQNWGQPFK
jgi:hypothetical protein